MTDRRIRIIIDSRGAQRSAQRINNDVTRIGRSADSTLFSLNKLFAAIAGAIAVNKLTQYADAWTDVNNQIIRTVDSQEDLIRTSAELLQVSNDTLTGIKETTAIYTSLSVSTKSLGVTQEEVIGVTKTINNLFREGGKSAAETAGAIRQLGQALESGTLRGDEFNSVAEGAPGILRAVELQTGMTRAELRKFASEGKIDAELLVKSLQAYEEAAQSAADKTTSTYTQAVIVANNNISAFIGSNEALMNIVGAAGDVVVKMSENLDILLQVAGAAAALYVARLLPAIVSATAAMAAQTVTAINQQRVIASMAGVAGQASNANRILAASAATAGRAMAFLGGPAGVLFLVVAALSAYSFGADDAAVETEDLSNQVDILTLSYKDLTRAQAASQKIDVVAEINKQSEAIEFLQGKLDRMQVTTKEGFTVTLDGFNEEEFTRASAAVDTAQRRVELLAGRLDSLNTIIAGGPKKEEPKTKGEIKNENSIDRFSSDLEAQTASLQRQLDLRSSITAIHRQNEASANASQFEQDRAAQLINEQVELAELQLKHQETLARDTLRFENKLATLVLQDEQEKALRAEFDNQQLINDEIFQQQKTAIEESGAKDRDKISQMEKQAKITALAGMAQSGLAILKSFGSKSFQSQKNFAIADGIVSIASGVAKAMNNPFPANLGFAAQVAGQGAKLISTIKSTKPGTGGGSIPSVSSAPVSTPTSTASSVQTADRVPTTFNIVGLKKDDLITGRQLADLLEQFGDDGGTINFSEG